LSGLEPGLFFIGSENFIVKPATPGCNRRFQPGFWKSGGQEKILLSIAGV
jgi:hypothetical protein